MPAPSTKLSGVSGIIQDKYNMTKQKFIQLAIQNGYDNNECNGWDWIRANLYELDYIFQTDEYKNCNGMKYKCMPLIVGGVINDSFNELETGVLETAWYCNNEIISEQKKAEKIKKLNDEGFFNIKDDEKLDKRKIEFIIDNSDEILGGSNKLIGKLCWSPVDKRLMAMKSKHRRRGHWIEKNVYVKFL